MQTSTPVRTSSKREDPVYTTLTPVHSGPYMSMLTNDTYSSVEIETSLDADCEEKSLKLAQAMSAVSVGYQETNASTDSSKTSGETCQNPNCVKQIQELQKQLILMKQENLKMKGGS